MRPHWTFALVLIALAACSGPKVSPAGEEAAAPATGEAVPKATPATVALPDYFDCVREAGGVLIAAHRGGPQPGFPENALETMKNAHAAGIGVLEIDVNETRDGVLFLMHDNRLNRTSTGSGYVSDTTWETVSGLRLVDNDGKPTAFSPPKLSDALLWAKSSGAILELDRKEATSFRNIVEAVKAAGAENNVIYISYTDEEAAQIASLAPDAMLTASAYGDRNIETLRVKGVNPERLIAWTGTREPYPDAWERVSAEGVEPAFGTLGREGESLDDAYWLDGKGEEYEALARDGLVLLATDEPFRVADAMTSDERAHTNCKR